MMPNANVQAGLVIPFELVLVLKYREPEVFDGLAGTHVDEPTADVSEEVGEYRVDDLDSRAIRLKHYVIVFHDFVEILKRILQEGDVGIDESYSSTAGEQLENDTSSLYH